MAKQRDTLTEIGLELCNSLGFNPTSNSTKPLYVANGLFRECTGIECRLEDIHEWVVSERRSKAADSAAILEKYRAAIYESGDDAIEDIKEMRFYMEKVYNPDLSNFLALRGKRVLLLPTQTPNSRTKYALFAVPYKKNYIVLNSSMANRAVENSITSRRFSFLGKRKNVVKEYSIEGYKTDLYIRDTDTIVEVKSVISMDAAAVFPTVYSERTINQLHKLQHMLADGKRVCFFIVSMHPYVTEIRVDKNTPFYGELLRCIELGMELHGFTARLKNEKLLIDKQIPIYCG